MISTPRLKAAFFALLTALAQDRRLRERLRRDRLTAVLNLHRVSPHANPFWAPLPPAQFETLVAYLVKHCEVTTFGHLVESEHHRPRVILSFDDGYRDFVDYAAPILAKYGVSANQNIIPACVESGEPPWNVQLYDFLNGAPHSLIREICLPSFGERLGDETLASKARFGLQLSRFLKNRPRAEREEFWQQLRTVMARDDGDRRTAMMTRDEVRQVAAIHEIGVHSYSHESMGFESTAFFDRDLQQCQTYFTEVLQLPLAIYAFPNGSYRADQIALLKARGIAHVLLVDEKLASWADGVHTRLTVYGDTAAEVRLRGLGLFARGVQ